MNPHIGFYSSIEQAAPEYDPPHDGPCIVCWQPLSAPLKTVSLLRLGDDKSYFYRAHKACYDASPERADDIAFQLIDGKIQ